MDFVENALHTIINLVWSVPTSLFVLLRYPAVGPRVLRRRLRDKDLPQVGPNTLLCICLAPLSQLTDFTPLLGEDRQPTLIDWAQSVVHGGSEGVPYAVLRAILFGIAVAVCIDIFGRFAYRRMSARRLDSQIIKLKYLLCVPALFSWVLLVGGWLLPRSLILSSFLPHDYRVTSLVAGASWLGLGFLGFFWLQHMLRANMSEREGLLAGVGLLIVLPVVSCLDNHSNSHWDQARIDKLFMQPEETELKAPLTSGTTCLVTNGAFIADVVFHNPYGSPLALGNAAAVVFKFKGSPSGPLPSLVVVRSQLEDTAPHQLIVSAHDAAAARFSLPKGWKLPAEFLTWDKGEKADCELRYGVEAAILRELTHQQRQELDRFSDHGIWWIARGPFIKE